MGLLATMGQIFVYWLIKEFKQHMVPFIITTRKITTSGLSLVVYNHERSWGQVMAIGMIFGIVLWEFRNEIRVKQHAYMEVDGREQGEGLKEVVGRGMEGGCESGGKEGMVRQVRVLGGAFK